MKMNARAYARVYLSRGKLTKPDTCERCSNAPQMHHPDYSQPLLVRWLCRVCHLAEHAIVDALEARSHFLPDTHSIDKRQL